MSGYYGTEQDHYEVYCEANDLNPDVFTIEDYREAMWDAENERRYEAQREDRFI